MLSYDACLGLIEAGQRKDRCRDKVLFKFTEQDKFYKIEKIATATRVIYLKFNSRL